MTERAAIEVRPAEPADAAWKERTLVRAWGSTVVARLGELIDASTLPGLVAALGGEPFGLLTFTQREREFEVVSLHVEREGLGGGRALMDAAKRVALGSGAARMWLTTTNNNARAFAFYQRWGMNLCRVVLDGLAASRAVKPSIPLVDEWGVPIRHELEFELVFTAGGQNASAST